MQITAHIAKSALVTFPLMIILKNMNVMMIIMIISIKSLPFRETMLPEMNAITSQFIYRICEIAQ